MRTALLGLIFLLFTTQSFAQKTFFINGYVIDPAENLKLENASVSVLHAKDSTLLNFSRTSSDGSFKIENLVKGNLILLMTYPGYADYVEHFKLDDDKTSLDFGKIDLVLKSRLDRKSTRLNSSHVKISYA